MQHPEEMRCRCLCDVLQGN